MDLTSRLRSIVSGGNPAPATERRVRELTYEPDDGYRQAVPLDLDHVADALGGRFVETKCGNCLVIDRRYESDRWHGDVQIGDCDVGDLGPLRVLDPGLGSVLFDEPTATRKGSPGSTRTIFVDLETTGLSGGAGTLAFLVGCGYFDLGAFQVRQFLLTSHSGERALLAAVADFFTDADLIVTYNGKTFDLPVMETRWAFHRIPMPLDEIPHFDMLHTARRLWKRRPGAEADFSQVQPVMAEFRQASAAFGRPAGIGSRRAGSRLSDDDSCCRLSTLERCLFDVRRVGDVPGFDIPSRFYRFVRNGNPNPLEPVLEHNRIDLVSLAAVTARAIRLAKEGPACCRDVGEALALGRIYERAGSFDRAESCFRRATESQDVPVRAEALYRLAVRLRRDRRFIEAAAAWRQLVDLTEPVLHRRGTVADLRQVAVEALAIHQEHRAKDLAGARELALTALEELGGESDSVRHRLARIDRKMSRGYITSLFSG